MSFASLAALVTTVLGLFLTALMTSQYVHKHRTHALWWGLSFLFTGVAAFLQFMAFSSGTWSDGGYRAYVFASSAVPALMGSGTMYLLWKRWALPFTAIILAAMALMLAAASSAALDPTILGNVMKASQEVTKVLPSPLIATGFAVLGGLGATALVLGAVWSWFKTRKAFNLGIAAGGIIFSLGDTLAAYGVPALFFLAEIVGILAIFLAVRAAQAPQPSREADAAREGA